jgi:tetratricopeptide (TPR) repeat protein
MTQPAPTRPTSFDKLRASSPNQATNAPAFVVRVIDRSERTRGTGFVVGPRLAVTCVHVVTACGAGPGDTLWLIPQAGQPLEATVLDDGWHPDADVAFLHLAAPFPHQAILTPAAGREGVPLRTFGYPQLGSAGSPQMGGLFGQAKLVGHVSIDIQPRLQISSSQITVGFSGAPLWEVTSSRVIGMLTEIIAADPYGKLGDVALALPAERLHALRPQAIPLQPTEIGGDVLRRLLVSGAPRQVFSGPYKGLLFDYIHPREILNRVDRTQFAGRQWLTAKVDDFLRAHDRGVFVLTAQTGLGKTTFLAHLVRERGYAHHFAELAPGQSGVVYGLRNLAAQLARAWELNDYLINGTLPPAADRPLFLQNLLDAAACQRDQLRPGAKIVLVVDALDQAGAPRGHNALELPERLPAGVHMIVSQRPGAVQLKVEGPRRTFTLVATSPKNLSDMRTYLEAVTRRPAIRAALEKADYAPTQFVETLLHKCQGVWVYLHYVVKEIAQGKRAPGDLAALPEGMTRYYARYWGQWRNRDREQWQQTYLPLLATLAAAKQGVTVGQLNQWAGVRLSATARRELLEEQWGHFITVTRHGRSLYHQFYHATLREFFAGQVDWDKLNAAEEALVQELQAATAQARDGIIAALRQDMRDTEKPETEQREAALRLTYMDWLDDALVSSEEMIKYLDLVARYIDYPEHRSQIAQDITPVLSQAHRQHAQLLVYQGGFWGKLGKLEAAAQNYEEAKKILDKLLASQTHQPEDYRLAARIGLGIGNLKAIQAERAIELEDKSLWRELLQQSVESFTTAAQTACLYKKDAILEATILTELGWSHALLENWEKAQKNCTKAIQVLTASDKETKDKKVYSIRYAQTLETAGDLHLHKGQSLQAQGNTQQALSEYETARQHARHAIAMLEKSVGRSEELVFSHYNLGQYLLATSQCPDCAIPEPLESACQHWQIAQDMAHRLGLAQVEDLAKEALQKHCQGELASETNLDSNMAPPAP